MGLRDHLPFINVSMDPGMKDPAEVPHLSLATVSQSPQNAPLDLKPERKRLVGGHKISCRP